jgi:hypothetical protein
MADPIPAPSSPTASTAHSPDDHWTRARMHPVWALLSAIVIGFMAGVGAYRGGLEMTNQETVVKGTWIPLSQARPTIIRSTAAQEIELLIKEYESVSSDSGKTRTWLAQVLSFVQGIDLDKDSEWEGKRVSSIEANIRYAWTDPSIEGQGQRTLGVLKGFQAALRARSASP